jgi:pilus assembly protein CpaF
MFGKRKYSIPVIPAPVRPQVSELRGDQKGPAVPVDLLHAATSAFVPVHTASPASVPDEPGNRTTVPGYASCSVSRKVIETSKARVQPLVMERIDIGKASMLPRPEFQAQISDIVAEILVEEKLQLNHLEQHELVTTLLDDMLGLGPLEALLADETVNDIMVNGPNQVYVERRGKLELTDVRFRDDSHVMNIASRIVSAVGRRIDETNPLVDARLADGSRVNIIIAPLALDGPSISIRKFAKRRITLEMMAQQDNFSPEMAKVLMIAGRCRLNILIFGGTG